MIVGRLQRGVGDRHDERRRHAVTAGVADGQGHPAVGGALEVVVVAADRVRRAVGEGHVPARHGRRARRKETALEVSSQLQLVAYLDPVDELEEEQEEEPGDGGPARRLGYGQE